MSRPSLLAAFALPIVLTGAIAVPATAQLVQQTPCTAGWHVWGAPNWTDNLVDAAAEAPTVSRLNFVHWLEVHAAPVVLQPGTYVAQWRINRTSGLNSADLELRASIGATQVGSRTWTVAEQPIGSYSWTPELIFDVTTAGTIDLSLWNINVYIEKKDYRFDSVRIGRVPIGSVAQHQSLDTWSWEHPGCYQAYSPEPGAVYGRVRKLTSSCFLSWLHGDGSVVLPAGTWVLNARARNLIGLPPPPPIPGQLTCGAHDLFWSATSSMSSNTVMVPQASQPAGVWFHTPNLSVTVPATETVQVTLFNTVAGCKRGYQFDSFSVRRAFAPYGASCGGLLLTNTDAATIGASFSLRLNATPTSSAGLFVFGAPMPSVALDNDGMPGCFLHVAPSILLTGTMTATGVFTVGGSIPNNATLLGATLEVQGGALDPNANPAMLLSSNAGTMLVVQ